jgi:Fe-S cluster assembly iron-binding protein IscA
MLQVTDSAASVFRSLLEQQDVSGEAMRLSPTASPEGVVGITLQPVDGPLDDDQAAPAAGVDVYVAPELVEPLNDAILDARETAEGAELFLRPQEPEATA